MKNVYDSVDTVYNPPRDKSNLDERIIFEGLTIGQYRIIRQLGRGGMGDVYLAHHELMGRNFALKVLPCHLAKIPNFVKRFKREIKVMGQLRHPNIVDIHYADSFKDRYYLVLEAILTGNRQSSYTLEDALIDNKKLTEEIVLKYGLKICDALHRAHSKHIVHRDLKPGNILITSQNLDEAEIKIADFGLAKLIGEDWLQSQVQISVAQSLSINDQELTVMDKKESAKLTCMRALLGTYDYMSPEQREGYDIDERSDIYAMGIIFYRLLTGKKPTLKPASKLVKRLDPRWDDLIGMCLEEPDDRYQSIRDIAMDLQKICDSGRKKIDNSSKKPQIDKAKNEELTKFTGKKKENNKTPEIGKLWTIPEVDLALVPIKTGGFQMGSDHGDPDEKPVHKVTLTRPFWIGKHQIRQKEFATFINASGYTTYAEKQGFSQLYEDRTDS